jgi:hypothetical protein
MRSRALLTMLLIPVAGIAQDEREQDRRFQEQAAKGLDTSRVLGWHPALTAGLNMTQVSFKDWAQGGENAFSYTLGVIGGVSHVAESTTWSNSVRLTFGQTRLGSQGLRKTDDEVYFESLLIYYLGGVINPYASFTLRTQFAPGFSYSGDGTKTEISGFFDPAYLTQSAGLAWQPSSILTLRLGAAAREIVTSRYPSFSDDPETEEIEKLRVQGGLESVATLEWPFAENMKLSSRLELFAPFEAVDRIVVRNDNVLTASVNRYVTVTFNVQAINDVNASPRTQLKETLSLGVTYTVL